MPKFPVTVSRISPAHAALAKARELANKDKNRIHKITPTVYIVTNHSQASPKVWKTTAKAMRPR